MQYRCGEDVAEGGGGGGGMGGALQSVRKTDGVRTRVVQQAANKKYTLQGDISKFG